MVTTHKPPCLAALTSLYSPSALPLRRWFRCSTSDRLAAASASLSAPFAVAHGWFLGRAAARASTKSLAEGSKRLLAARRWRAASMASALSSGGLTVRTPSIMPASPGVSRVPPTVSLRRAFEEALVVDVALYSEAHPAVGQRAHGVKKGREAVVKKLAPRPSPPGPPPPGLIHGRHSSSDSASSAAPPAASCGLGCGGGGGGGGAAVVTTALALATTGQREVRRLRRRGGARA